MSCFSIEILTNLDIPGHLKTNGKVFLDLDAGATLEVSVDQPKQLSNGRNIIDGAKSITIPYTQKNHIICRGNIDAHVIDQKFPILDVLVIANGIVQDFSNLYVEGKDDKGKKYTVRIGARKDHPLILANNKNICDITYLLFSLTKANIEAQFSKYNYQDGDNGYFWGFAWYGKSIKNNTMTVMDVRPWYSPLYMLRQGFLELGWHFSSEILETTAFRNTWMYLSDSKYGGNSPKKLDRYKFLAQHTGSSKLTDLWETNTGPYANSLKLDEIFDNSDRYLDTTATSSKNIYVAPPAVDMEYIIEYKIDVTGIDRNNGLQVAIVGFPLNENNVNDHLGLFGTYVMAEHTYDLNNDDLNTYEGTLRFTSERTSLDAFGSSYFGFIPVWARVLGDGNFKVVKLKFYNEPKRKVYTETDVIPMSEPLSCDISLGDVLRGIQDLVGGFVTVDWQTQSIVLKTSYDTEMSGDAISGYYDVSQTIDISDHVMSVSQQTTSPDKEIARYQVYGFNKSTDAYIKRQGFGDADSNPFDKKIDLGEGYKEETKQNRNPLFEPTELAEVIKISATNPVHLPHLVDNLPNEEFEDGEHSYDIGPRICMATPDTTQYYLDPEGVGIGYAQLNWYDGALSQFPIFYNTVDNENFTLGSSYGRLIYGNGTGDLWSVFLGRLRLSDLFSQKIIFDTYMNPSDWVNIDISKQVSIKYGYEFIVGFIDSATRNLCTGVGKLSITKPIDQTLTLSGQLVDIIDNSVCDRNNPLLLFTTDGTNDTYTLGGTNISPVLSVLFEKEDADINDEFTGSYSTISDGPTTVDVPVQNGRYGIRMTVNYTDGCSSIVDHHVQVNCANYPAPVLQQIFSVSQKSGGYRISLNDSLFKDPIDTISATIRWVAPVFPYTYNSPQSYTIDTGTLYGDFVYVWPFATPNFELTTLVITFTTGCTWTMPAPIDMESPYWVQIIPGTVMEGALTLKKVSAQSGGRYVPDISSYILSGDPDQTVIMYKNDDTTDFGEVWNSGVGPVGKTPSFKVVFTMSDNTKINSGWIS